MSTERLPRKALFGDIYLHNSVTLPKFVDEWPKTILLTGANGMLGNGLAVALRSFQKGNFRLILASRSWSQDYTSSIASSELHFITNEEISNIEETVDLVIHTASPSNITQIKSFEELEMVNLGILKRLEKLQPKKIVYISTGEVYKGGNSNELTDIGSFSIHNHRDWYPMAKLQSENSLKNYANSHDSEVDIIRLFHTFGPGVKSNDGRSFADIIWGATVKQEIVLKSLGEQTRSFLYLSDAIDGILSIALSRNKGFSITNLGSPIPVSIRSFAEIVAKLSRAKVSFHLESDFPHSPNDSIVPNVEKLMLLGWHPRVPLEEAVNLTIKWIRDSTLL